MSINGDGNGNGHASSSFERSRRGDEQPSPSEISKDAVGWVLKLVDGLRGDLNQLICVVGEIVKSSDEDRRFREFLRNKICAITTLLERVLLPMAEQNRSLGNREIDERIIRPLFRGLALIVDRLSREITEAEGESPVIECIEGSRALDVREMLELMATFGVEAFVSRPGTKLDSRFHDVGSACPTSQNSKVGRVRRSLRTGYRRQEDDFAIRKELVEAWAKTALAANA